MSTDRWMDKENDLWFFEVEKVTIKSFIEIVYLTLLPFLP